MKRSVQMPINLDPRKLAKLLSQIVVIPESGCWVVPGYENVYRRVIGRPGKRPAARTLPAHRYFYEVFVGPVPKGLVLDRLCGHCGCVNPLHLEPVTPKVNTRRGRSGARNAAKTHCHLGHPLSGQNLYLDYRDDRSPRRLCRTCRALAARRHYHYMKRLREARFGLDVIVGIDNCEPRQSRTPDSPLPSGKG